MFKELDMNSIFAKILSYLFLIVACWSLLIFNSGQVYGLEPFDIQIKKRINSESRKSEIQKDEKKVFKGSIIAWLINQVSVTEEEEFNGAIESHEKIKTTVKFSPTPLNVNNAFKKLVSNIPSNLNYKGFTYELFVLDQPDLNVFTNGGGYVYITKPLLEKFLDVNAQPTAGLYFILANELGKISHKHTRRGYQLIEIEKELKRLVNLNIEDEILKVILQTSINPALGTVKFLYTPHQVYQADIFAFYLCRNSGIQLDDSLDALRLFVVDKYPKIKEMDFVISQDLKEGYSSFDSSPLVRMKKLLNETEGVVDDSSEKFGLLRYQKCAKVFELCKQASIAGDKTTLVFCHGLKGNEETFKYFIEEVAKNMGVGNMELLVFRYPNNQSLSRSGQFLTTEINRVFKDPKRVQFICHSAGGLVFRHYAEINNGSYGNAFFIGTPHKGSDIIKFKFLIDTNEFVIGFGHGGLPKTISDTIPEGRGEIGFDLQPGSLFLSYLDSLKSTQKNYFIFNANYTGMGLTDQGGAKNKLMVYGLENYLLPEVKKGLVKRAGQIGSPLLKKWALEAIAQLEIPDEVKNGDLAVTIESSKIGSTKSVITRYGLNHIDILNDSKVITEIIKKITLAP